MSIIQIDNLSFRLSTHKKMTQTSMSETKLIYVIYQSIELLIRAVIRAITRAATL
tara:strand:- start:139 stop:303 length:165 start_codon:yes stop_codon:yes gene_type:complete